MDLEISVSLRRTAAALPGGDTWIEHLPELLDRCLARWPIEVDGAPYRGGSVAVALPVLFKGEAAVLKLGVPHDEAAQEAEALRFYDGGGAVRLLAADEASFALVVERCEPGTSLAELVDLGGPSGAATAVQVGTSLLARIWRKPSPAHGFVELSAVTSRWSGLVAERVDRLHPDWDAGIVQAAIVLLRDLPASAGDDLAVLHTDFHPGNVLASGREPWLLTDPKPMVGDRAFDPVQLLTQVGALIDAADPVGAVRDRLAEVGAAVDVHPSPLAAWGLARCVEWAAWSLDRGDAEEAQESYRWAELFARELRD